MSDVGDFDYRVGPCSAQRITQRSHAVEQGRVSWNKVKHKSLWQQLNWRHQTAADAQKVDELRNENLQLRTKIESLRDRLDEEKRKRRHLEKRLSRQRQPPPPAKPSSPHAQVFQELERSPRYTFGNVVSYPKSGRTWFSTLYFHCAISHLKAPELRQQSLNLPDRNLAFQEMLRDKAIDGRFPVCVFTHLGFSEQREFERRPEPWPDKTTAVLQRRTVLIIRDPRDVVVSHFHHLRALGSVIDPHTTLSDFVRGSWGIERVVRFMNLWAAPLRKSHPNLTLCRFESLKANTAETFARAIGFLGEIPSWLAIERAIEEASFDRLKAHERSSRTYQGASLDPQAFRFRSGTVGSHAVELSASDIDFVDEVVSEHLDPVFRDYRATLTTKRRRQWAMGS